MGILVENAHQCIKVRFKKKVTSLAGEGLNLKSILSLTWVNGKLVYFDYKDIVMFLQKLTKPTRRKRTWNPLPQAVTHTTSPYPEIV